MTRSVQVRAPCRLHFGMFSFGQADRPQFGGVGVMVDPPAIEVTITPSGRFSVSGALPNRVEQFAKSAIEYWRLHELPACEIAVRSPPDHVGLGVGTQLGLAVAAGLRKFLALTELPIDELASSVGRGARSAVGTYGFRHGGLIVDRGKRTGDRLGMLARRVALPETWQILLVRPPAARGLAGDYEADAFARLPPVPPEVTRALWQITESEMLPAIENEDCTAFGEAVYRFGRVAGECFAAVQGGPFANHQIARVVESIRAYGVPGVGQSSWGPTVFAFTGNEAEAQALSEWLREKLGVAESDIIVARPNNSGAHINRF
ncbi:MAG: hypothetical protein WD738_23695 [Pirellulales bacterium]